MAVFIKCKWAHGLRIMPGMKIEHEKVTACSCYKKEKKRKTVNRAECTDEPVKICRRCGKAFDSRRLKYCSVLCMKEAEKERKRNDYLRGIKNAFYS